MTDCELLELAAKAAGVDWFDEPAAKQGRGLHLKSGRFWNPIIDDGDALRLAVKCALKISHTADSVIVSTNGVVKSVRSYYGDPYAATRRAIVRAAAEIGKGIVQAETASDLPEGNYYKTQAEAEDPTVKESLQVDRPRGRQKKSSTRGLQQC